jgi:8-oxo-dGTP pyrophosphatase MutT (NUDIX family)
MIKRDVATDRFKHQLDMIRATFKKHCDDAGALKRYDLFPKSVWGGSRNFGGLADTVAVLNGFLAAGIAAAWMFPSRPLTHISMVLAPAVLAVLVGGVVAYGLVKYANAVERKAKFRGHAGGVVYRFSNGVVEYLLVSPSKGGEERVLPKGHIEPGEEQSETALREVKEEAGVVAELIGFIDRAKFQTNSEMQDVAFFLMRQSGVVPPECLKEKRAVDWAPLEAALDRLSYDESKSVLRAADSLLRKIGVMTSA